MIKKKLETMGGLSFRFYLKINFQNNSTDLAYFQTGTYEICKLEKYQTFNYLEEREAFRQSISEDLNIFIPSNISQTINVLLSYYENSWWKIFKLKFCWG